MGRGYINPRSLITVRILSPRREVIDSDFFYSRLAAALQRGSASFREGRVIGWCTAKGISYPGLIVDRYQDHLVLQTLTLGMELRTEAICEALERLIQPHAIVARNDVGICALEGLPDEKKVLRGRLEIAG